MLRKADQPGFAITFVIALLLVGITSVALYLRVAHLNTSNPSSTASAPASNIKVLTISEGSQSVTIDANTEAKLPTGATIDLQYFRFDPSKRSSGESTNQVEHSGSFKAYHKGYLYEFTDYRCQTGRVSHDDYSTTERISCSMTVSAKQADAPAVASYSGISFTTSSQSRQIYDHSLQTVKTSGDDQKAYYSLQVPYMQFWGKGEGTYWGASGNELRIKTVYGVATLGFDEKTFGSDLQKKTDKSVKLGPLTVHVHMTGVGCYVPYLESNGQCYPTVMTDGPNKGQTVYTYNRVDYVVSFDQLEQQTPDALILHY